VCGLKDAALATSRLPAILRMQEQKVALATRCTYVGTKVGYLSRAARLCNSALPQPQSSLGCTGKVATWAMRLLHCRGYGAPACS
jgi:hypothetical protein